jgi:signal peptidase
MEKEDLKEFHDIILGLGAAILVVLIILGSLYLYTSNWPPMVVVESGSMQHSSDYAYLGDLNIGDMVLVRKVTSVSQVITYVQGERNGFSSYGEFGNVIVYRPYGSYSTTPIIHRAIVYLQYNSTGGGFNIPSLAYLNYSDWFVITPAGDKNYVSNIIYNVEIKNVGYPHTPVIIPLQSILSQGVKFSGFITMGDYNHAHFGENATDQGLDIFPYPVKLQWIDGVATGLLPYFGLIKLSFDGGIPPGTPQNSIFALMMIIAGIVILGVGAGEIMKFNRKRKEQNNSQDAKKGSD